MNDELFDGGLAQGWRTGLNYPEIETRADGLGLSRRKLAHVAVPVLAKLYAARMAEDLDASDITRELIRRGTPTKVTLQVLVMLGESSVNAHDYINTAQQALRANGQWDDAQHATEPDLRFIAGVAITGIGLLILALTFFGASPKGGVVIIPTGLMILGIRLMIK